MIWLIALASVAVLAVFLLPLIARATDANAVEGYGGDGER